MITKYFKRLILVFIFLLSIQTLVAQVAKSEYFMRTSYMRTYLNPALRPDQGQLIVPVLPNLGVSLQTNAMNLDHLTFRHGGERVTFLHPSVSDNEFLKDMHKNNYLRADVNYKLFAFSLFHDDKYTSIDIGLRAHADINLPRSVFGLLKVGFNQDKPTTYDLKDISASAQSFVEIGIGQSRAFLNKSMLAGIRVKGLLGAGYMDLKTEQFDVTAGPEEWRSRSKVHLKGAAPGVRPKFNDKEQLDGFDFDFNGLPGYGLGLDFGMAYDVRALLPVLSGLKLSVAVNDVGFICWTRNNTVSLSSSEQEVVVNPSSMNQNDDQSIQNVFDKALDDLQKAADLNQVGGQKNVVTALRATMLLGVEYEFIKHTLSAGALYSVRYGNYANSRELTLSGNYQPYYWLGITGSYSFVHSAFDTFGLAVHLAPRKGVTFFFASDYVIPHVSSQFVPTTSKAINLQVGFSIPIGQVSTTKF